MSLDSPPFGRSTTKVMMAHIKQSEHLPPALMAEMALQDVRYRYQGSTLGVLWVFIQPCLTVLVFWTALNYGLRVQVSGQNSNALWLISGYVPWLFFSDSVLQGTSSIVEKGFLLKKVRFPFYDLPLVKLVSCFFVHLVFVIALVASFAIFEGRLALNPMGLYFIFCNFVFCLSLIRILALIQVVARDFINVIQFAMTILFWLSPVLWNPVVSGPRSLLSKYVYFNPVGYIVMGYRAQFLSGFEASFAPIHHVVFWSFVVFFWLFSRLTYSHLKNEITDYL